MKSLDVNAKAEALQAAIKYRNKMIKSINRDIFNSCDGLKKQINQIAESVQSNEGEVAEDASIILRNSIQVFQEIEWDIKHIKQVEEQIKHFNNS